MSQKKTRGQSASAARRQEQELASRRDRERGRMDPTARRLLLGDLVFLAVTQIMYQQGMISEKLNTGTAAVGTVLVILALYFQFWRKGRDL